MWRRIMSILLMLLERRGGIARGLSTRDMLGGRLLRHTGWSCLAGNESCPVFADSGGLLLQGGWRFWSMTPSSCFWRLVMTEFPWRSLVGSGEWSFVFVVDEAVSVDHTTYFLQEALECGI